MNENTIKLLNNYNKNTEILNISNKNIKGILDLANFKELTELYCYSNEITEIINIPTFLEYLNCSNNKIQKLGNINFLQRGHF